MKFKIKVILILTLVSIMLTGHVASAATYVGMDEEGYEKLKKGIITEDTYYVSSKEEEIIEFNRGMATNKPFTLDFASGYMDGIDWYNPVEGIQDYANSHYAYYNFSDGAYDFYYKTEDGKDILRVRFDWYGKETVEETKYVYNFIREMIRNNPSIIKASDYDKTKWAYDWIVSNVKYDYTYKNSSAYQGLTDATVCEGYAKIFYVFATELGLDCFIVNGMAGGEDNWGGHAWNVVRMEDGKWYVVDTTWGAAGWDWLLKGNTYTSKDHRLNKYMIPLLDIPDNDYVNTGNSEYRGVLGSVFGIKFDPLKKNILGVGERFKWLVDNPDNIELTFSSEDESIATVSEEGIITATGEGIVLLKAINEELGIEQRFTADVRGEYNPTATAEDISIKYGESANIKLDVSFGKQVENVKYKSKDKSIATVNKDGKVKGVRVGETTITIRYEIEGIKKEADIKVTVKPAVNAELKEVRVNKGNKISLRDAVKVSKNGYKDLTFKTSNKKVATVSKTGYVTGKGRGECKVYIYDKKTNKKVATVNVNVTAYRTININDLVK